MLCLKKKKNLIAPPYDDSTCNRRDGEITSGVNLGPILYRAPRILLFGLFTKYLKGDKIKWSCERKTYSGVALQWEKEPWEGGMIYVHRPRKHSRWPRICHSAPHLTLFAIRSCTTTTRPCTGYQGMAKARSRWSKWIHHSPEKFYLSLDRGKPCWLTGNIWYSLQSNGANRKLSDLVGL